MIQNEARVNRKLRSLGGHENIVEVLRQGEVRDCGMFYVDMELCDGNLEHFIEESYANDRSIDLRNVWNIAMEIVSGVVFIHKHGEVHRDLKPRNSMAFLTAPETDVTSTLLSSKEPVENRRLRTNMRRELEAFSNDDCCTRNSWLSCAGIIERRACGL